MKKIAKKVTRKTAKKQVTKKAPARRAKRAPVATVASESTPLEVPAHWVYCLRTCDGNRQGYGGFQWPERGPVEAPDWSPKKVCGFGLHGLLKGEGGADYFNWEKDAIWLVVAVDPAKVVDIDRKVKFPRGIVVYSGNRETAAALVKQRHPESAVFGSTATAGDGGTATAGDGGTATAGNDGTATAGARGTATAGARGTATAGDCGTATAGDCGTATAGYAGTATAGNDGTIQIKWWDEAAQRYRVATGYIGEGDLKPKTKYKWDNSGKFAEVTG